MEAQYNIPVNLEEPANEQNVMMMDPPDPSLCSSKIPKVITLNRLILLLTDPSTGNFCTHCLTENTIDDYLLRVFWWTYRQFVNPDIVLKKFIERFDMPSYMDGVDENNASTIDELYYNNIVTSIELKICKMLTMYEHQTRTEPLKMG